MYLPHTKVLIRILTGPWNVSAHQIAKTFQSRSNVLPISAPEKGLMWRAISREHLSYRQSNLDRNGQWHNEALNNVYRRRAGASEDGRGRAAPDRRVTDNTACLTRSLSACLAFIQISRRLRKRAHYCNVSEVLNWSTKVNVSFCLSILDRFQQVS